MAKAFNSYNVILIAAGIVCLALTGVCAYLYWQYTHAPGNAGFLYTLANTRPARGQSNATAEFVSAMTYHEGGGYFAVGWTSGHLDIWHTDAPYPKIRIEKAHDLAVTTLTFSHDGATLFSGSGNDAIRQWDSKNGNPIEVFPMSAGPIMALPEKDLYLIASQDQEMLVYDAGNHKTLSTHPLDGQLRHIAVDMKNRLAATHSSNGELTVWRISDSAVPLSLQPIISATAPFQSAALAFSIDGARLYSVSHNGGITEWDSATLARRTSLDSPLAFVATASFAISEDAAWLALSGAQDPSGLHDRKIELIDLQTLSNRLISPPGGISPAVAFISPPAFLLLGTQKIDLVPLPPQ